MNSYRDSLKPSNPVISILYTRNWVRLGENQTKSKYIYIKNGKIQYNQQWANIFEVHGETQWDH